MGQQQSGLGKQGQQQLLTQQEARLAGVIASPTAVASANLCNS